MYPSGSSAFGTHEYQHRYFEGSSSQIRKKVFQQPSSSQFENNPSFLPLDDNDSALMMMKNSQYNLINRSRHITKDEVGYEGIKFQQNVLDRYSESHKKDFEILERFKREAEEERRKKRYRHLPVRKDNTQVGEKKQDEFIIMANDRGAKKMVTFADNTLKQQSRDSPIRSVHKNSVLNHTRTNSKNSHNHHHTVAGSEISPVLLQAPSSSQSYGQKQPQINPKEKQSQHPHSLKSRHIPTSTSRSIVIAQESSENDQQLSDKQSTFQQVRDVGVQVSNIPTNVTTNGHYFNQQQDVNAHIFQIQLEAQKRKNHRLKLKYEKLRSRLLRSNMTKVKESQKKEFQRAEQMEKQFDEKISSLSNVMSQLCVKLKQNNEKMVQQIRQKVSTKEIVDEYNSESLSRMEESIVSQVDLKNSRSSKYWGKKSGKGSKLHMRKTKTILPKISMSTSSSLNRSDMVRKGSTQKESYSEPRKAFNNQSHQQRPLQKVNKTITENQQQQRVMDYEKIPSYKGGFTDADRTLSKDKQLMTNSSVSMPKVVYSYNAQKYKNDCLFMLRKKAEFQDQQEQIAMKHNRYDSLHSYVNGSKACSKLSQGSSPGNVLRRRIKTQYD